MLRLFVTVFCLCCGCTFAMSQTLNANKEAKNNAYASLMGRAQARATGASMDKWVEECSGNQHAEGAVCHLTREALLEAGPKFERYAQRLKCPPLQRPIPR
jgi:hypothetical protein